MVQQVNGVTVGEEVAAKWDEFGGFLGEPVAEETEGAGGGRRQDFAKGVVVSHPEVGVHALWGPIGMRWVGLGGTEFGYPETEQGATIDGAGLIVHCRQVHVADRPQTTIVWTSRHGAHGLFGPIRARWSRAGFWVDPPPGGLLPPNPLGFPAGEVVTAADGVGASQAFAKGVVVWHPKLGAFGVLDPVAARWRELGGEVFGYPVGERNAATDGSSRWTFRAMQEPGQADKTIAVASDGAVRELW